MGWNIREGTHAFSTACPQTGTTLTDPIFDYDHSQGDETVIGGHVYHGTKMPALAGGYVFGDFGSGRVWAVTEGAQTWTGAGLFNTGCGGLGAHGEEQVGRTERV